ncbi:MAG: ribulose-phosphate 3-epimerase [Chitinispirillia bacterium]|nr:ribulose-phosphate 3-epimerase [Chitinispirillia bacterium]MCL2241374.1 ribulose-phosphate 3-epimerase [Chitinispirillia bacterium]
MKKILVSPSILSADFRALEREVKAAEDAGADLIHCDVMDGHFVPNLTFGPLVVEAVKKCVSIPLDVHLMISDPAKYAPAFCGAGADILVFHAEAAGGIGEVRELLDGIRAAGVRPGVAVNPDKPVSLFMDALDRADQVLIMSVYAGFGGQKFMPEVMEKVRAVRKAALERGLDIDIEVDGGVNAETAAVCAAAGANVLVAGNYVFNSGDYAGRIGAVRGAAEKSYKEGLL